MFKTPVMRKSLPAILDAEPPPTKRGWTADLSRFQSFCDIVLKFENYTVDDSETTMRYRHTSSPLGSTGSSLGSAGEQSREMETSPLGPLAPHMRRHDLSDTETDAVTDETEEDEEITCICRKPYGGRPMIQCSSCLTWLHFSCAKVKKGAIPREWFCSLCKKPSTKIRARSKSRARKVISGARRRKSAGSASSSSPPSSSSTTIFRSSSKRKL